MAAMSKCRGWRLGALAALSLLFAGVAQAGMEPQEFQIPGAGSAKVLKVLWAPVDAEPRPVVVALHGCGGLYRHDGHRLDARYPAYIERLHALGVHVLLPDSFGSRGLGAVCAERYADRQVSVADRRADVLAALEWLRQRPEVDASRLALLGWSNGATTALTVMDANRVPAPPPLAAVVMFYPGCAQQQRVKPLARSVLLQLGASDDWTPAAPCEQLARRWQAQGVSVQWDVYPGAYHGFDSTAAVRFRGDVPNGVDARGVHQGGQAQAAEASAQKLDAFLRAQLDLAPPNH